ncbi:MAG: hypothetical protein K0R47_1633 [Brevibacillus sp.]|nr:hypothetical protein [Brevibacillus sp.]
MIPLLLIFSFVTFPSMLILSRKGYQRKEVVMFFVLSTLGLFVWVSLILKHPFSPDEVVAWVIERFYDMLP